MFHPHASGGGTRLGDAFVVALEAACPCGERTGVLSRIAFDFDSLTLETIETQVLRVVAEPPIDCTGCKVRITGDAMERVVLVYEFEDGLGTVLARTAKATSWTIEYALLKGGTTDLVERLTESKDPFAGETWHPALTNELVFSELGRVFSMRARWLELLRVFQKRRQPVLERVAPGCWLAIYSPETHAAYEDLFDHTGLGPLALERRSASVKLNGLDGWEPEKRALLEPGSFREWLPKDLHRAIAEGLIIAEVAVELDEIMACAGRLAQKRGLEATRVDDPPREGPDGEPLRPDEDDEEDDEDGLPWSVKLSNKTGFHSSFRPEVVFVKSVYQCRTLGESVAVEMIDAAEPLVRLDKIVQFLRDRLPEGTTFEISESGLAQLVGPDGRPQLLNLPSLAAKFDVDDEEDAGRLLKVATTGRQCDCEGYIGKKLKTRGWLDAARKNMVESSAAPTHHDSGEYVEVYSYECDHDSRYSPDIANGDDLRAEQLFQRDAERHVWKVYMVQGMVGKVVERPVVAAIGPNAASLALHPGFVRSVIQEAQVTIDGSAQVFAPISGMCIIAPKGAKKEELQEFAWKVFTQVVTKYFPQVAGEELQYWDVISLPADGSGKVVIEGKG